MGVKNWGEYQKKKQRLLQNYETIKQIQILPIGEITESSLDERKSSLETERFYISACGQMKAGKSTLLNALLFSENILPVDDTVMTAKITLIQYRDREGIEVCFYSAKEWKELEAQQRASNYFEQWQEDLNNSIEQGIYPSEVIKESPFIKQAPLRELGKYVALPKQGGIYAPYVKSITVFTPNLFLEDVIVVDTPGINDTNQLRANITKDWIQQADAVIYVSYAGQAMSAPDIDFINDYLLHVPATRRVLAINKIDTVSNMQELDESLEQLARSSEPALKSVFGETKAVCYVSAAGALIEQMRALKKPMDQNLQELEEILEESGQFTEPKNHRFLEFKQQLQQKLIENKGEALISSHQEFQKSIFTKAIQQIQRKIAECQQRAELLNKNHAQLEDEKKKIGEKRTEIEDFTARFRSELEERMEKTKFGLSDDIRRQKEMMIEDALPEIRKLSSLGDFRRACWIIKSQIEKRQQDISEKIKAHVSEFSKFFSKKIQTLKDKIDDQNTLNIGIVDAILQISAFDLLHQIGNLAVEAFSEKRIEELTMKVTAWYQRWFSTSGGVKNLRSEIETELHRFLDQEMNRGVIRILEDRIEKQIEEKANCISSELQRAFALRKQEIDDILQKQTSSATERKNLQETIHHFEQQKQQLSAQQSDLE